MNAEIRPPAWSETCRPPLSEALANPPDCYRPVPWLAWTGELHWPVLRKQLQDMLEKGIREFFLFPIYGMELPYMSAAYWERVGQTLEFCRDNGMKCWIYDEYNWPSGVCAGQVLRDHPEHAESQLWIQSADNAPELPAAAEPHAFHGLNWAIVPGVGVFINVRGSTWNAPVPGYLDVLSPDANRSFIEHTHERYHRRFAEMFPKTLPGFFTDEPGMHGQPGNGWARFPYTRDLFSAFHERYGYDLRQCLGDLVSDLSDTAPRTRCHYWRFVAERFGAAYARQQREWCDAHGVALTGHCLAEEALSGHVRTNGDLWEFLRHFTVPGIDLLANADGFNFPYRVGFYSAKDRRGFHLTCKMVHGIVRHSGGREMLSEAFGVCDWGLTLQRQRCGFNYQVALGVTLFNDNSLITSIADFRKWAIAGKHFTQPWWEHYKQYADYNARVAALHAEGEPVADIAVLYPRSTIWARCGASNDGLEPLQETLYDLLDELVREQWHFDMLFEPVLAEAVVVGSEIVTPHARYRALIVPAATILPRACMEVLREFAMAGGTVLFCGDPPALEVDSLASLVDEVGALRTGPRVREIEAAGQAVCRELEQLVKRPLRLAGVGAREFVSSCRRFGETTLFFVANMAEEQADIAVTVPGEHQLLVCEPDTLDWFRPDRDGNGTFLWHFEPWQAVFLAVSAEAESCGELRSEPAWLSTDLAETLDGEWAFSLDPGNMLRLTPQVRLDPTNAGVAAGWCHDTGVDGWLAAEGGRRMAEPILPEESPWYWLRATVHCNAPAGPRYVVCDNPDFLELYVNGSAAEQVDRPSLWTEENVAFDVAGRFCLGANTIHIRARTSRYNDPRVGAFAVSATLLQPVVLVGDFLVGQDDRLLPWAGMLNADTCWELQGLPHVGGTGTYRRNLEWDGREHLVLHLPHCTDAVDVHVNGRHCGTRVWAPYVFDLADVLTCGANVLELNVRNTLGNIITETYGGVAPDRPPVSGLLEAPRLLAV
ncbi:MAG: hypothetical protein HN742_32740 [Lentisphaerae bacterium]|nr:hypothetical protein [Lentisphaerota bacterium]MBT4815443.1 hypothetical protein [Lentisphaerota bacterium]MBT5605813.1 hypothetical protein [Lentisphaerota bacterium]MBT7055616.1 hypothetical protein [Lentisphaerota bacterium]MBT7846684.1 hypothetical protein [Lentisphaerota bacterium]